MLDVMIILRPSPCKSLSESSVIFSKVLFSIFSAYLGKIFVKNVFRFESLYPTPVYPRSLTILFIIKISSSFFIVLPVYVVDDKAFYNSGVNS